MINFYTDQTPFHYPWGFKGRCSQWIKYTIGNENYMTGTINIIVTSDEKLLETNKNYLGHDYYTDIITFNSNKGNIINGELYISFDRVSENASNYGVSFVDELKRVIIHGVLHLVGYNDKLPEEKKQMTIKENQYLNKF